MTPISPRNQALWYRRFGNPADVLTLEDSDLVPLAPGMVRVQMIATPVNPSDLIPVTGAYRHRVQVPRIAGHEGVGIVVETGAGNEGIRNDWLGRRVLPLRGAGTWQRYVDTDPAWMVAVPDDIDDDLAARAYINPLAAMLMLRLWPARNKHVLVTAAGSSCANLLAQWALLAGAHAVTGIYRSPRHREALTALGVSPIGIDDADAIAASAAQAELVFDAVGGSLAGQLLAGMPADGNFVSYGLLSGMQIDMPATGCRPKRFHLRDHLDGMDPSSWQSWFGDLWPLLRGAVLSKTAAFPLSAWQQALAMFAQPGRREKPILEF